MVVDLERTLHQPTPPMPEELTPEYTFGRDNFGANHWVGTSKNSGLHCYWRKPNGEITIAGTGQHEWQSATMRGMEPLHRYGVFPLTPVHAGAWDPPRDPFRLILQRGGIGEFSLDQILQLRWHLQPHPVLQQRIRQLQQERGLSWREALDEVIPQLKGVTWEEHPCRFAECARRPPFNSEDELRRHEVLHREDSRIRQQNEALAQAIEQAAAGNTQALLPILQQLAEAQTQTQQLLATLLAERSRPAR